MSPHAFLVFTFGLLLASGCRTAPKIQPTFPLEPGLGACTTTIERDGQTGTIRTVREGAMHRSIVDLDGDGNPEEQHRVHFDSDGRVSRIERFSADGKSAHSVEVRAWDGRKLIRREVDQIDGEGRPGPDGAADEVHELTWQDGVLVRETIDQLAEDGLLGVDGTPDLVTTWTATGGKRTTGTRVDARDEAVLRVDRLTWSGDDLVREEIDLGGDGVVDVTIINQWEGGRLVGQKIDGKLQTEQVRFTYCD